MAKKDSYDWKFVNVGGMTRVNITTGEDIRHLPELDQKLWTVLSCPVEGLEFDAGTLRMLDTDGDGKIRVKEILEASRWLVKVISDPDLLLRGDDSIPLSAFNLDDEEGRMLHDSARQILENLGKGGAEAISVADTSDSVAIFAKTRFNGDGLITVETADDEGLKAIIGNVAAAMGSVADRSGAAGVGAAQIEGFYAACADYDAWRKDAETRREEIYPFGDGTDAALAACEALKDKISDYFLRCKLVGFNADSSAALDVSAERIGAIGAKDLNACVDEIASYPLSRVRGGETRLAYEGINPAWKAAFDSLRTQVLDVVYPGADSITEDQWNAVLAKFAAYSAWKAAKKGGEVEGLGLDAVRAILREDRKAELLALVEEDRKLEGEASGIDSVNRLAHYYRDFYRLLCNYVTMADFFTTGEASRPAVFQCGHLYIEQRRLDLCIKVADMSKHGEMAAQSGMFIIYCTCTSKVKGASMNIAAVLTDGDIDNIRVGQNAVFYDREGLDWDAVVTKIVDNPVSIRQAFWSPYRKAGNAVSERIAKSAAEKDQKVSADLMQKASTARIPATEEEKAAAAPAASGSFDIAKFAGIFAAFGMAMGMIGSAIMKIIDPWYNIITLFVVLVVVISGPSMFLAWLKLRKRNLAPVLNANGWAINSKVLVNARFGATLTELAKYPRLKLDDPFAPKMSKGRKAGIWICSVVAALAVAFAALYFTGNLKCIGLPFPKEAAEVVVDDAAEVVVDGALDTATEEAAAE